MQPRTRSSVEYRIPKHGRVDILLNDVARSEPGRPDELSDEAWDLQIHLNLKSVSLSCHFVLAIIEKQETCGSIVYFLSVAGLPYIGKSQVAYSVTKAGIIGFTKTMAVIYAKKRVTYSMAYQSTACKVDCG